MTSSAGMERCGQLRQLRRFSPAGSQVGPCVTGLWTPVAPMVLGKVSNFMGKFQVVLLMFIKLGMFDFWPPQEAFLTCPVLVCFLVKILQLVATRHAFEWHLRQLRGGYHYCGTAGGGELPSGGLPSGSCDAVGRENPGGFEGKPLRNPWESQGNPWVWVLRSRFPGFLKLISRMVVLLSSFKGIRALFFLGLYSVKKLFTESMPKKVWELLQSCAYRYDEIFLTSSIPSAHQKKNLWPAWSRRDCQSPATCVACLVVWQAQNYEYHRVPSLPFKTVQTDTRSGWYVWVYDWIWLGLTHSSVPRVISQLIYIGGYIITIVIPCHIYIFVTSTSIVSGQSRWFRDPFPGLHSCWLRRLFDGQRGSGRRQPPQWRGHSAVFGGGAREEPFVMSSIWIECG